MTQHAKGRANQDCCFTSFCCFELVCRKDGMMRMVRYTVFSNIERKVNIEEPLNNHLGVRNWCNILYPNNSYVKAWHLILSMLSFSLEASCGFATCHPFTIGVIDIVTQKANIVDFLQSINHLQLLQFQFLLVKRPL